MDWLGLAQADVEWVFIDLLRAYGELQRWYHVIGHIEAMLTFVEAHRHLLSEESYHLVVLATLFHDYVYSVEPDAANEEKSAQVAADFLRTFGAGDQIVNEVVRLIMLTKDHAAVDDLRGAVLVDADLQILAAEEEIYGAYVANVRREYGIYSDHQWALGRAQVLRHLLGQQLFHLPHSSAAQARAIANMVRELTTLTESPEKMNV